MQMQRSQAEKLCRLRLALARFRAYIKACSVFQRVQMRVRMLLSAREGGDRALLHGQHKKSL